MTKSKHTDYEFSRKDARDLMSIALLPHDIRVRALTLFMTERSVEGLIQAFSQFIGLANSVVANNRDMIEMIMITEGGAPPHTAEKVNLPTIFGALSGVSLADGIDQSKTCGGCAYRLGTPANQSPCTTADADWCAHPSEWEFMCHEDLDENGKPKRKCIGFTQDRRNRARREREAA